MNFIKASISSRYLYSPISWLHLQNEKAKFYINIIQLAYLTVAPLKNILFFFIITILLLKSIKAPKYIARYFYENFALFAFFIVISAKHSDQYKANNSKKRPILKIYLNWNCSIVDLTKKSYTEESFFYIPISLLKLVTIHLIHLVSTKYFMLTTRDERVMQLMLGKIANSHVPNIKKLIFITTASPQFLEIIFEEIDAIKVSILIRNYRPNYMHIIQNSAHKIILLFQYLLCSINNAIHNTAKTLYARDIKA